MPVRALTPVVAGASRRRPGRTTLIPSTGRAKVRDRLRVTSTPPARPRRHDRNTPAVRGHAGEAGPSHRGEVEAGPASPLAARAESGRTGREGSHAAEEGVG